MTVINKIEYLSQRNPKWAETIMGSGSLTVGRYGCTTTCISMLTDYFGCKQSPKQIALNKKNYSNDSNISWIGLNFPTFSFRWREGNLFSNAQNKIDIAMIKSYLAPNPDRAVLLEVANRSHWVVGLWWSEYDEDILAIDPWTGETCLVYKTYKNITGASLFVRGKNTKRTAPIAPKYN